jgi:uncharacterized protein involved in exopolysaccharide biosynthesis
MHNQTQVAVPVAYEQDEIDLRELLLALWLGRRLVVVITALFTLGAILFALLSPNYYQSSVVLAPAQNDSGGLSATLGQLGGLASLAGINLGDANGSEAQIAQEIMQSRGFIEQFIQQTDIAVEVMAAKGWDAYNNQLKIDHDIYDSVLQQWTRDAPRGKKVEPSLWEIYEQFSEMLSISQDKKTGLVTVSLEYFSPYLAKQWLDKYVLAVNLYVQQRKIARIKKNIQYLEEQIEITSVAEMRKIFFTLIEEQVKSKMLVEASPEYAFITVSEAMVAEERSKPKRKLIVILGALLGLMLSIFLALLKFYWFNKSSRPESQ